MRVATGAARLRAPRRAGADAARGARRSRSRAARAARSSARCASSSAASTTCACNWKVFVDNYLDGGYHVNTSTRASRASSTTRQYRTEIFAAPTSRSRRPSATPAARAATTSRERIGEGALYAWIYPNLMLNRYGPILDIELVVPLGPDRCEVVFDYWFTTSEADAARRSSTRA